MTPWISNLEARKKKRAESREWAQDVFIYVCGCSGDDTHTLSLSLFFFFLLTVGLNQKFGCLHRHVSHTIMNKCVSWSVQPWWNWRGGGWKEAHNNTSKYHQNWSHSIQTTHDHKLHYGCLLRQRKGKKDAKRRRMLNSANKSYLPFGKFSHFGGYAVCEQHEIPNNGPKNGQINLHGEGGVRLRERENG